MENQFVYLCTMLAVMCSMEALFTHAGRALARARYNNFFPRTETASYFWIEPKPSKGKKAVKPAPLTDEELADIFAKRIESFRYEVEKYTAFQRSPRYITPDDLSEFMELTSCEYLAKDLVEIVRTAQKGGGL